MGSAPLEETSLDTVGLNGTAREVNVIKLLQLLVDVVGIPVPRDDSAVEDLQHAVVAGLMGVIGAPDDVGVARSGDEIVRRLDAALRAVAAA